MDDLTKKRFDGLDKRFDELPKAIAQAFGEAFTNARADISQEIQAYHAQTEQAADRRHGELVRLLTNKLDAVPTCELRDDPRFPELDKAITQLRAEVAEIRQLITPAPTPPTR